MPNDSSTDDHDMTALARSVKGIREMRSVWDSPKMDKHEILNRNVLDLIEKVISTREELGGTDFVNLGKADSKGRYPVEACFIDECDGKFDLKFDHFKFDWTLKEKTNDDKVLFMFYGKLTDTTTGKEIDVPDKVSSLVKYASYMVDSLKSPISGKV